MPNFRTGDRVRTTVNAPSAWANGFSAPAGTLGTITAPPDVTGSYSVLLDGDPDGLPAAYDPDELTTA